MKINQRVLVIREALTRIVPMLTQQKVEVTMRGTGAFVQYDPGTLRPKRVNLPYLPDDASDHLIDAVQGFLDHEVGHILFTDPATVVEATKRGKEHAFMANAVEDTFVERKMTDKFRGSAFNLANTGRFFLKKMVEPNLAASIATGNKAQVFSGLVVPVVRAHAGQEDFADFIKAYPKETKMIEDMIGLDLLKKIPNCNSSQDCFNLAMEMQERIAKQIPPQPQPQPQPDGKKGEKGEKGEKGDKGKGSSGKDKGDKKDEKAPGKGDKKDEKKDSPGEQDGAGQGEGEDEGPTEAEGQDGTDPSEEGDLPGNPEPGTVDEIPNGFLAAIRREKDYDDSLSEIISSEASKEAAHSDYRVFTRDDDKIEPLVPSKSDMDEIPHMQDTVDSLLGPIQKDLERAIAAKSAVVFTGGHRRGRINGAALHTLRFGRDDVFKQKQQNTSKDVAVSIVVDCSGSMTGQQKIVTACFSAYGLAAVLDRMGVKCEVLGFTTSEMSHTTTADLAKDKDRQQFARYEALNIPIFKDFGERMTSTVRGRFIHATRSHHLCASNVDGESVLLAAQRLASRRETRKVMLVLSDGRPAVHGGRANLGEHLKAVVKSIEAVGIDVVGIGIKDDSVRQYYTKHIVMQQVADLPAVVGQQLKRMLIQ